MKRLRWYWSRRRRQLGWPGAAGAALLAYALLVFVTATLPELERTEDLRRQMAALAAEAGGDAAAREQDAAHSRLAVFYQGFPDSADAAVWVDSIFVAGGKASLMLERGEYSIHPDPGGRLTRYEISLPARGTYPQIRDFLQAVLSDIPALAIQDIHLERTNIGEPSLEARIRFALFLREKG